MPRKKTVARPHHFHCLLSDEEDEMLTVGANRAGLTTSDYVRQWLRGQAATFQKSAIDKAKPAR